MKNNLEIKLQDIIFQIAFIHNEINSIKQNGNKSKPLTKRQQDKVKFYELSIKNITQVYRDLPLPSSLLKE